MFLVQSASSYLKGSRGAERSGSPGQVEKCMISARSTKKGAIAEQRYEGAKEWAALNVNDKA